MVRSRATCLGRRRRERAALGRRRALRLDRLGEDAVLRMQARRRGRIGHARARCRGNGRSAGPDVLAESVGDVGRRGVEREIARVRAQEAQPEGAAQIIPGLHRRAGHGRADAGQVRRRPELSDIPDGVGKGYPPDVSTLLVGCAASDPHLSRHADEIAEVPLELLRSRIMRDPLRCR